MATLPLVGSFVNSANVTFFDAAGTAPLDTWAAGYLGTTVTSQLTWTQSSNLGFAYGQTAYFSSLYSADTIDVFLNQINTNITGQAMTINAERSAFETQYATLLAQGDTQLEAYGVVAATLTTALISGYTAADFGLTGTDATTWNNQESTALNRTSVSNAYAAASGSTTPSGAFLVPTATTGEPWAASQLILTGVTADSGTVSNADAQISAALAAGDVTPIVGQSPVGQTYTLTTGTDNIIITANNATVIGTGNGVGATFTPNDTINGGAFTGNSFDLSDISTLAFGAWGVTNNPGATVSGIQTVNIVDNGAQAIQGNFTATGPEGDWAGLTNLNVVSHGASGNVDLITVDATTAVQVTDTLLFGTFADLTVTGGSTVAITEANGGNPNFGITVNGGSGTTDVSVTQTEAPSSANDAPVLITDVNYAVGAALGTITTVTLDGLDTATSNIHDSNLGTLNIYNVDPNGATVALDPGTFASPATTLALNLNNDSGAGLTITDTVNPHIQTLNLAEGNQASTLTFTDDVLLNVTLAGGAGAGTGVLTATFNDAVAGAVNFNFTTAVNGDSFTVNRTTSFGGDSYTLGNAGTVAAPEVLNIATGSDAAETISFGSGFNTITDIAHAGAVGNIHAYVNTAPTGVNSGTVFTTINNTATGAGNYDTLAFSVAPTSLAGAGAPVAEGSVGAVITAGLTQAQGSVGLYNIGTVDYVFEHVAGGPTSTALGATDAMVSVNNGAGLSSISIVGVPALVHLNV
jgi:hypothetical protein